MTKRRTYVNIALVILVALFVFNGGIFGLGVFAAVAIYLVIRLLFSIATDLQNRRRLIKIARREYMLKLTAKLMGLFFITGTLCYIVTFSLIAVNDPAAKFGNTELILRSMICSLDMFMLDVDGNILDHLAGEPVMKALLMVQATLSFGCTAALLISLVISRARAYYLLQRQTKVTADRNHLYLFFGLNDNSQLLASDISQKDPASIIIFIENTNVGDDDGDSWSNIVSLFTHKPRTFELADKASALVAVASKKIADIDDESEGMSDLLSVLGLKKIKSLVDELGNFAPEARLRVFFMSENEDDNIRAIINLAKDETILKFAGAFPEAHTIYCHARRNGPNRVVEDLAVRKRLNVHIVDSSHLAVELLKSDPSCQPVEVISFRDSGGNIYVGNPLEALIVGFGEVGRDAFRFLYEFGTFVDFDAAKQSFINRYPHITAIDNKMRSIDGQYIANCPVLQFGESTKLYLKELDCDSAAFFTEILSEAQCKTLNYIVIALGDDDRNISLAIAIFNRIRRYRKEMSNLIIMVRCVSNDKYGLMQRVADHYNKGSHLGGKKVIRLFGAPEEIYRYDTIIRDHLTERGKKFLDSYRQISRSGDDWDTRHRKLTGIVDGNPDGEIVPDIDKLRSLRRKESQDLANALHSATKLSLLRHALGQDADLAAFSRTIVDGNGQSKRTGSFDSIAYRGLEEDKNDLMKQMAANEHARWMAAHALLGYAENKDEGECDERTMLHNCMVEWEKLDEASRRAKWQPVDYKEYDYIVVETTLSINFPPENNENNGC